MALKRINKVRWIYSVSVWMRSALISCEIWWLKQLQLDFNQKKKKRKTKKKLRPAIFSSHHSTPHSHRQTEMWEAAVVLLVLDISTHTEIFYDRCWIIRPGFCMIWCPNENGVLSHLFQCQPPQNSYRKMVCHWWNFFFSLVSHLPHFLQPFASISHRNGISSSGLRIFWVTSISLFWGRNCSFRLHKMPETGFCVVH